MLDRHEIEARWHDTKAQGIGTAWLDPYSMGALELADAYMWDLLGDVSGKVVIDFGCGRGHNAICLAEKGAIVYAFDISSGMARVTYKRVSEKNLENRVFVAQMAAEQLAFPEGFADLLFGHSILHHTDLPLTRKEVHRVLKSGGRAVFLEPLNHNPLIRVFRHITPSRRTPTEKPLRFEDVIYFIEPFSRSHYKFYYLTALAAFVFLPLRSKKLFQAILRFLERIDNALLARWPHLGRYAWVIVLEVTK